MKFIDLLILYGFTLVSEAKDISCVRKSSGVECFDQISLQDIITNENVLLSCKLDDKSLKKEF